MLGALIGAGASIFGGLLGSAASSADREEAINANREAVKAWLDINVPDANDQKILLQRFVQSGQLTPQLEAAVKRDASAYEQIQVDPRLKESQMRALSSLENIGAQGGLTIEDKANLQKQQSELDAMERGKREAISDQMARRGISGSGLDLVSKLSNEQSSINRASQNQLDTLGAARKRALDAILSGGTLAGQMGQQQYAQQADLAKARDSISDFNARNMQSVAARNIDRGNEAQQYNLGRQQKVSDMNVGVANEQEKYNKALRQQEYENRLRKAGGVSAALGQQAQASNAAADRTAGTWAGIGSGINQGIAAYGQQQNADRQYGLLNDYLNPDKKKNEWDTSYITNR